MWVNNLPKVATQWNSGTTREWTGVTELEFQVRQPLDHWATQTTELPCLCSGWRVGAANMDSFWCVITGRIITLFMRPLVGSVLQTQLSYMGAIPHLSHTLSLPSQQSGRYDTIDDLHWITDRKAASLMQHLNFKELIMF